MKIYKINGKCSTMQVTCISQFIKSYYLKFSDFSLGISKNLEGLYVSLLLMNLPLINNDNWTEWSQFWSEIVLMISNRTPTPCSFYLKIMHVICVGSHDLQVHFGINQLKQIFQRLTKLHELVGWVQFVVFEKFKSSDLCQISEVKSCDYLLII